MQTKDGLLALPSIEETDIVGATPDSTTLPTTFKQLISIEKLENDNVTMLAELEKTEKLIAECDEMLGSEIFKN